MISDSMDKQKVTEEAKRAEESVLFRMWIVFAVILFTFVIVTGRTVYLHLSDNTALKTIAEKQYNARIPLSVRRGKIYDRNGSELAVSLPVPSVYADPEKVEEPGRAAKELGRILGINEKDLLENLKKPRRFVWLKRRLGYDKLKEVMAQNLVGIGSIEESKRFYPNGEVASQVLGAVGYDSQALSGMEMSFNDVLVSKKKAVSYKRDARGKLYEVPISFGEQTDVGEIYLTIDKQIQFFVEVALRDAVETYKAADGVAVVMDPRNGEILAMASAPRFDPNRYSKYPVDSWRNRPVTDVFEPGSTFKVFVIASAIEGGVANTKTVYNCENGAVRVGKETLHDTHPYGKLPVEDVIKFSSNICAYKVASALGKENLYASLKKFGIGTKVGIEFPGEVTGTLRNASSWQSVEFATVAFGQGLTVTPLQMTAAFSSVINGGVYYRPHLMARAVDQEGNVAVYKREEISRPISAPVSEAMRYMLKRVVEKGGTGFRANSESFVIGGKTGTAQKVDGGKRYAKGKYFASFMGFAPVDDPVIVVFVGLDEPKGQYYGGTVAAPAVKEIIERSLNYIGVKSVKSPVFDSAQNAAPTQVKEQMQESEVFKKPVEFKDAGGDKYIMPDLTGFTMREIYASAKDAILEMNAEGSGIAVKQSPEAGRVVGRGEKFSVKFRMPE